MSEAREAIRARRVTWNTSCDTALKAHAHEVKVPSWLIGDCGSCGAGEPTVRRG
ncbi:unnamed protein product [Chondrus crispus]|uniref:Uncharacterized protein n=1 Tax=Chondrus crispus TaxID=2769 RepID=R7Q2Y8_CHOCR|nr:unnamed protein product [Chondrus crispus]XP_005712725.1 unnamed protein product [Chondrus crispus]CDF32919.1 unnamed protein product [Chondrus crispus]CDF32922.1 unnamed protein product [Chondrus crispus]|eukprot:XP_005712722.1 unnamed protein product [Chondrus crispus]